jgi:hypothetical protein
MTDDFDVSLRRRLESLATSVPVAPGEVATVASRGVRAGSGTRLGFAGLVPVLAVLVGGTLLAGIAKIGPFAAGTDSLASDGAGLSSRRTEASTRSGNFVLTIRSAKASYAAGEIIEIEASLTYDGSAPIQIAHGLGGAGGPIGFGIEEPVLGGLHLGPTTADVCARTALAPGQTLTYGFAKSGTFDGHDPSGDDYKRFFEDPDLRLAEGTWHVYAVASFSIGDCTPEATSMRVDLSIEVVPAPVPPAPSPSSDTTEPPNQPTSEPPGTGEPIDLATRPDPDGTCSEALGGGLLARNSRTGLGFAGYVHSPDADVIWPFGYSARIEGRLAVLVDREGRIVAREGDPLLLVGGWIDNDDSVFAACGVDPWAGTPLTLTTAVKLETRCEPELTRGLLGRADETGLGIADDADVVTPVRWPLGYTATVVQDSPSFDGLAVLFDGQNQVVAWEGAPIGFADVVDTPGTIAACMEVHRVPAFY